MDCVPKLPGWVGCSVFSLLPSFAILQCTLASGSHLPHQASSIAPGAEVETAQSGGEGSILNTEWPLVMLRVHHFFRGWRCIFSPSCPKKAQLTQPSKKISLPCPASLIGWGRTISSRPRVLGLWPVWPAQAAASWRSWAHKRNPDNTRSGGEAGERNVVGNTAHPAQFKPSFWRVWLVLENKVLQLSAGFCLLEECLARVGRGLGGGKDTSVHPWLAKRNMDGALLFAHEARK